MDRRDMSGVRGYILCWLLLAGAVCAGCHEGGWAGGSVQYIKPSIAVMKFENRAPFPLGWNLGDGMKDILRKLQPERFEDLIALNALYRPGPLKGGLVDDFIKRRHGQVQVEYIVPQLKPILQETYGVIRSRIDVAFEQMLARVKQHAIAPRTACQLVAVEELVRSLRDRVWI